MARTGPQWDTPTKNRLIGAIQSTGNVAASARKYGFRYSTAWDLWAKFKETGTTHTRPCPGRPKKVTDRVRRLLVRNATKSRRTNLLTLGSEVQPKLSTTTVRRILVHEGYHRRVARRAPYLTKAHKKARVAWAEEHQGDTTETWSQVIFSDECYVCIDELQGRILSRAVLMKNSWRNVQSHPFRTQHCGLWSGHAS